MSNVLFELSNQRLLQVLDPLPEMFINGSSGWPLAVDLALNVSMKRLSLGLPSDKVEGSLIQETLALALGSRYCRASLLQAMYRCSQRV